MKICRPLPAIVALVVALVASASPARAADPGVPIPPDSEASDQKLGSILVYNLYTSGGADQDTRLTLTNASGSTPTKVRLFLVDGPTRSVTSTDVCLSANQTTSLNASSLRAGSTGYVVAVAIDANGCPIGHNFLGGQAHVRFLSGFRGVLKAVGIALIGPAPVCGVTAALDLNSVTYNRVPRVLALPNLGSLEDDFATLLVVNRIGGNLASGASAVQSLTGLLYDDAENYSIFSFESDGAQFLSELSDSFPATAPPFSDMVPAGRTGWMRLFNIDADAGYLGAAMLFRSAGVEKVPAPDQPTSSRGFVTRERAIAEFAGAVNLHALPLTSSASYTMSVSPAGC